MTRWRGGSSSAPRGGCGGARGAAAAHGCCGLGGVGVSIDWVYANARALGAIRLGSGPRARLRFDRATIMDRIAKVATNLLTHHLLPAFAALRLSQLDYAVIDRYVEVKQLEARKSARRRGAA